MKQYELLELTFTSEQPGDDWVNIDLIADIELNGRRYQVKGFYCGNQIYKIRFLPEETGLLRYKVTGLIQAEGELQILPPDHNQHGQVRALGTGFEYADHTKFLPFGTTVYALLHQNKGLIEETMNTMRLAPFNKIRFCVFPKFFDFNRNEPEIFAFHKNDDGSWNTNQPYMEFWDEMDLRISQFNEMGVQVDLILFHPYDHWGFMHLSRESCISYLDYAVRRLSSHPNIWWSLANEYDLLMDYSIEDWENMAAYIQEHDTYGHLLSNHNFVIPWDFSNKATTHVCLQSSDAQEVPFLLKKYQKPVVYDEVGYEGNIPYSWGNLSAFELVNRFWKIVCYGGYATHGETYMEEMNDEQLLWWSKGGQLKGESVERIRFLRNLLESFSGIPQLYQPSNELKIDSQEDLKEQLAQNIPGFSDNPVFNCMARLSENQFHMMQKFFIQPVIHLEEQAFLQYYGDMCTISGTVNLPENGNYKIEIIDVWEMTRTTAAEHVNGKVQIVLPGKPGIAVLATLIGEKR